LEVIIGQSRYGVPNGIGFEKSTDMLYLLKLLDAKLCNKISPMGNGIDLPFSFEDLQSFSDGNAAHSESFCEGFLTDY
jgi:hypothetical protein